MPVYAQRHNRLHAELLEDVPGALSTRERIEANRVAAAPCYMLRIVVAVDPAVTSGEGANETGIVIAGLGVNGHGYEFEDLSGRMSPDGWAQMAVGAYRHYQADRIVGEVNNGGDLIKNVLRTVGGNVAYRALHASRGKVVRAEPIAALYEQGRIQHVGLFPELEGLCSLSTESKLVANGKKTSLRCWWPETGVTWWSNRRSLFLSSRQSCISAGGIFRVRLPAIAPTRLSLPVGVITDVDVMPTENHALVEDASALLQQAGIELILAEPRRILNLGRVTSDEDIVRLSAAHGRHFHGITLLIVRRIRLDGALADGIGFDIANKEYSKVVFLTPQANGVVLAHEIGHVLAGCGKTT